MKLDFKEISRVTWKTMHTDDLSADEIAQMAVALKRWYNFRTPENLAAVENLNQQFKEARKAVA